MHWFLPFITGMAFLKNKKWVILLSFLAVIPDLDTYFGLHRYLGHNLFILIPFIVLFFVTKNKIWLYALYFLGSHLFMDMSYPGIRLFWPFTDNSFMVHFFVAMKNTTFLPYLDVAWSNNNIFPDVNLPRAMSAYSSLIFLWLAAHVVVFHKKIIKILFGPVA